MDRRCGFLVLMMCLNAALPAAQAQYVGDRSRIADSDDRIAAMAVNAGIGAVVAGVRQVVTGRPLWPAVAQGAGGGLLMGAGKNVAGMGSTGSGLVGRQIHAMGIALAAAPARDSFAAVFPIGPLHIGLHPGSGNLVRTRVDLFDLVVPLGAMAGEQQRIDWRATASAGTPVLVRRGTQMPGGHAAAGFALGSTVYISDRFWGAMRRQLIAHETIHVLQWDAYRHLLAHPVERTVLRVITGGSGLGRRVDLGLLGIGSVAMLAPRLERENQWWEREAKLWSGQDAGIWR